jgi:hypothetical protein
MPEAPDTVHLIPDSLQRCAAIDFAPRLNCPGQAAQLDLAGAGRAVFALAVAAFGLGRDDRNAGAVDAYVQHVGQRAGWRQVNDLAAVIAAASASNERASKGSGRP